MTKKLSNLAEAYIDSAAQSNKHVKVNEVRQMVAAIQKHMGTDWEMPIVAEAVEYGNIAYLKDIASGNHSSSIVVERAQQVLGWLRGKEI